MKSKRNLATTAGTAALLSALALGTRAQAQSADALIDKLVQKGILTVQEAKELQEESDKGFHAAHQTKTGMADWVNALKFNGDLRGRYEGFFSDNPNFVDRNRLRYRLRFGAIAVLKDQFEVGLRLSSSEPGEPAASNFGGDPVSGNTTFGNNGSKKFVYLDLAYAKWTPLNKGDWTATTVFGKMENPFTFPSTMVFDKDYTPEGLAQELSYHLTADQTLKWVGGGFVLDELQASGRDPYLLGTQLRLDSAWSPKFSTTLGGGFFAILGKNSLNTGSVPDQNKGNTRNAAGDLANNYNPIYVDGGATYKLDSFPGYKGAFPIALSGDYLHNPAVRTANDGYSVGVTLGKAGKKGLWDLHYRWTELQADAWYEEFTESDFGAFYQAAPAGGKIGYGSGTNVRGHWIKASYSPYDSLTFSVACFVTELIQRYPLGADNSMTRLQVDALWKF